MSDTEVTFQHERVNNGHPLVVNTGMDEVSWSYKLHTAKYPTYGGEVIQILSCYIDSMNISGTVRTYEKAEEIYKFFAEYFIVATQGPTEHAGEHEHFVQVPMVMTYKQRHWQFEIQPMSAPGFVYSLETIAPRWTLVAHIVDGALDVQQLQNLVLKETNKLIQEKGHTFDFTKLIGEISPDSGNPANNPFIAPVTPVQQHAHNKNNPNEFEPIKHDEVIDGTKKIGDYYLSLLPTYASKNFEDLKQLIGGQPNFARKSTTEEKNKVTIPAAKKKAKKTSKTKS